MKQTLDRVQSTVNTTMLVLVLLLSLVAGIEGMAFLSTFLCVAGLIAYFFTKWSLRLK